MERTRDPGIPLIPVDRRPSMNQRHANSSLRAQNINDPYRYGSLNAGVFPPDQTWNPVDMTSVHTMTDDIDSASSIHESGMLPPATTDSEQGASVAPSKMVHTVPSPSSVPHASILQTSKLTHTFCYA